MCRAGYAWLLSVRHRTYSYSEYCNTAASLDESRRKKIAFTACARKSQSSKTGKKFLELVQELNRVLETKERRMEKRERESEED